MISFSLLLTSLRAWKICAFLCLKFQSLAHDFCSQLESSGRLSEIRNHELSCSAKISLFLDFLQDDLAVDPDQRQSVKGVLQSLKQCEGVGNVNAVFIDRDGKGLMMPLHVKVQPGSGKVECLVKGSEGFQDAIQRTKNAMKDLGYTSESEDILYTLHLTDIHYEGSSIAVATAVGIYDVKRNLAVDPYTAFTGDINLDGQDWVVQAVMNVPEKIAAAKRAGCRRVFVPAENYDDVKHVPGVKVRGVKSLIDVFIQLQPSQEYSPGDSLRGRKIRAIQEYCHTQGWYLGEFESIQAGLQSTVAPLELKPLKVQIYNSGTHTPKSSPGAEYDELFSILNDLDMPQIPIRGINEVLNAQHPEFQRHLQAALEKFSASESSSEPHCIFSFKFAREKETLTIKQYKSGKLIIQGSAGPLYKSILEIVVPVYKVYFPKSDVSVEYFLTRGTEKKTIGKTLNLGTSSDEVPLPYIGTDESGKGDYLGSMVIAGVFLDLVAQAELAKLGVKDSKLLTDKRCKELAVEIRKAIPGKYHEVEIPPERYNQLYDEFKYEHKNLNHLLAWGHARAIEDLLQKHKCSHAVEREIIWFCASMSGKNKNGLYRRL